MSVQLSIFHLEAKYYSFGEYRWDVVINFLSPNRDELVNKISELPISVVINKDNINNINNIEYLPIREELKTLSGLEGRFKAYGVDTNLNLSKVLITERAYKFDTRSVVIDVCNKTPIKVFQQYMRNATSKNRKKIREFIVQNNELVEKK